MCHDAEGTLWCVAILSESATDTLVLYSNRNEKWHCVEQWEMPGFACRPNIAAVGDGLCLAYDRYIDGRSVVETRFRQNESWSSTAALAEAEQSFLAPRLTVAADGTPWLCYLSEQIMEREGVINRAAGVRVARARNGEWENVPGDDGPDAVKLYRGLLPQRRYFGYSGLRRNPRLVATEDGAVHLVWESQRGEMEKWQNVQNGFLLARSWRQEQWEPARLWLDGGCCFGSDHASVQPSAAIPCFVKSAHRPDGHDFQVTTVDPSSAPPFPEEEYSAWRDWKAYRPEVPAANRPQIEHGGKRFNLYFGDFHNHSVFSPDAEGHSDELYHFARDVAQLDFVGITDNDFYPDKPFLFSESAYQRRLVKRLEKAETFLPYCGFEWTFHRDDAATTYNHRSVVFLGDETRIVRRIEPQGFTEAAFRETLWEMNVFAHAHHAAYELLGTPQEANVEVTSGWAVNIEQQNAAPKMLDAGHRFGFIGGSDSHRMVPGMGGALVAVWAETLSREAIEEALRLRRCYATTGNRTAIDFRLNGVLLGGVCAVAAEGELEFQVRVAGERPLRRVTIIGSSGPLHEFSCDGNQLEATWKTRAPASETAWYYLRVEDDRPYQTHPHNIAQAAGPLAWSSPIWVEREIEARL